MTITNVNISKRTTQGGTLGETVTLTNHKSIVVQCGMVGAKGADGVMTEPEVVSIIHNTIHANSTRDAIIIKPDGNIKISIRSLLPLP